MRKAFTLVGILVVIGMFAVLAGGALYLYRTVLAGWVSAETRAGVCVELYRAMNMITRDIQHAGEETPHAKHTRPYAVTQKHPHELRFYSPADSRHYIYYLYSQADGYPNTFMLQEYDIRRCPLGNLTSSDPNTGTFRYGAGQVVANGILPPSQSPQSSSLTVTDHFGAGAADDPVNNDNNVVTIVIYKTRDGETVGAGTAVAPRNVKTPL